MATNTSGLILGDSLEELTKKVEQGSANQGEIIAHNLGAGIKEHKIKVLTEGTVKTSQQEQNTRALIEAAPDLAQAIGQLQQEMGPGYSLSYGYDPRTNTLHIYPKLTKTGQGVGEKPITIALEDLQGNVGGTASRGREVLIVDRSSKGGAMASTAGVYGLNKISQALQNKGSNLFKYLQAARAVASSSPENTKAIQALLNKAGRSIQYRMRTANEAARPGETFVGSAAHAYKTDNPAVLNRTEQTLAYGHVIEELFNSKQVKDAIKASNKTVRDIHNRLKANLFAGADISRGIPKEVSRLASFKNVQRVLEDMQRAGISIQELNDEAFGHGYALGVPTAGARNYGYGRQGAQAQNIGKSTQQALAKRGVAGANKRYLVLHADAQALRKQKGMESATDEGGLYLEQGLLEEMDKVVSKQRKFSSEEIAKKRKETITSLKKKIDDLGGGEGAKTTIGTTSYDLSRLSDVRALAEVRREAGRKKEAARLDKLARAMEQLEAVQDSSDNFAKEYIYSRLSGKRANYARTDADRRGFGFENIDGVLRGVYTYEHKAQEGEKVLGPRVRDAVRTVVKQSLDQVGEELVGVKGISAAKAMPTSVKARKISDYTFGISDSIAAYLSDQNIKADSARGEAVKKVIENSPLAALYSVTEEDGFLRIQSEAAKWEEIKKNGNIEQYINDLMKFFENINDFTQSIYGNSKNANDLRDRAILRAFTGNVKEGINEKGEKVYNFGKGMLSYGTINPISATPYGMPGTVEALLDSRVQHGAENMMALGGVKGNAVLNQAFKVTSQQLALQKQQKERAQNLIEDLGQSNSLFATGAMKGNYDEKGGIITVGFGPQYDIDLSSQEFSSAEYGVDGQITGESFANSPIAYIRSQLEKLPNFNGDMNKYRLYLDTNIGGERSSFNAQTYATQLEDGRSVEMTARAMPLLSIASDAAGLRGSDIGLWSLINQIQTGKAISDVGIPETEALRGALETAIQSSALGYIASFLDPIYNSKNTEYQQAHKVEAPSSIWGTNVPSSFAEYEGRDKSVAYMSPEAMKGLLEDNFSDTAEGLKAFNELYSLIDTDSGKQFTDLKEGIEALVEFLSSPNVKQGLLGSVLRYPASTGEDLRFADWRVDKTLEGTAVKMSRGLSKLLNGDFDGDRILSTLFGLGEDTDMESLKALYKGGYKKLAEVTNRAAEAIEARMKEEEAEAAEKGVTTSLEEKTLKGWSSPVLDKANATLVGALKGYTGSLSNAYQAWADYGHSKKLDETVLMDETASEEDRLAGARGLMGRTLFSETTQQAISAKKLSDKMKEMGEEKWSSLSEKELNNIVADIVAEAMSQVENIMDLMKNPDFYAQTDTGNQLRGKFLEDLKGLGVTDENGVMGARVQESMLAALYKMAGNDPKTQLSFFRKLFPNTNITEESLDKIGPNGELQLAAKDKRLMPTAEDLLNAFIQLNGQGGVNIAEVMKAGRVGASKVDSDNAVLKVYFAELGDTIKKALQFAWKNPDGTSGNGGGASFDSATISAQNITINAASVTLNGTVGGNGNAEEARKRLKEENLQITPFTEWGTTDSFTSFAANKFSQGHVRGQYEEVYSDFAKVGESLEALRGLEKYQGSAGEALIEGARSNILNREIGTAMHGILDARNKGVDESDVIKEFLDKLGNFYTVEEKEGIKQELLTSAGQLEEYYKTRPGYSPDEVATEVDLGYMDPKTGDRIYGRGDVFGLRTAKDRYGNEQLELNVGDYKKLSGDKISPQYAAQILAEQMAVLQFLSNFEQLGINSSTTADDLNALLSNSNDPRASILKSMGYRPQKGNKGEEGYSEGRFVDDSFLEILKKFYNFYGGDVDKAARHLTGTIYGVNSKGLQIRSGIDLMKMPDSVLAEMQAKGFTSPAVQQYFQSILNPYRPRGKRGSGGEGAGGGDSTNNLENGGEVDSLTEINQLLTQRLQLERQIAQVQQERENLQKRVGAGDEDANVALADAETRLAELQDIKSEVDEEIEDRRNNLTPEAKAIFNSRESLKTSINNRRIAVDSTASQQKEQDSIAKEYERSLRERLQIESKIDQLIQRRNTTLSKREVEAIDLAVAAQNRKLSLVEQEGEQLKRNKNLRVADRKSIEQDYAVERAAQKAQNESANHGSRNVWDMLGYDIKRSFAMIFDFGLAHRAINSIQMKFRELITTIQELDKAMTNIRIVTGQTQEQASDLMKTYNDLASELGTTTLAIAEASNEWLRQGYSISETEELIRNSTMLSTLGMISASDATSYLTSMLKGFKLEVSETSTVLDELLELDVRYAASAGDIAEALSRTATSAQLAGMSLEETAAAVTTIIDVSQRSASSVGEMWKTITGRFGNVKAGSFIDLETGEADESLNDIEKVFNTIGISIRSSSMEFRDLGDVLDDLNNKWASLTTVEKNAVATAAAGLRQREGFLVLMENYDSYQEAIESASESEGNAAERYEAYMDSIEAHLAQLKDAWDELAQNFEGSTFFKGVVDVATFLVENLPKIIKYFGTLFVNLNAYKLPVWMKQIRDAVNPFKSVAAGRDKGFNKAWTTMGMSQRAMRREADYRASNESAETVSRELFGSSGAEFNYTPEITKSTNKIVASQDETTQAIKDVLYTLKARSGGKANGGYYGADIKAKGRTFSSQGGAPSSTQKLSPGQQTKERWNESLTVSQKKKRGIYKGNFGDARFKNFDTLTTSVAKGRQDLLDSIALQNELVGKTNLTRKDWIKFAIGKDPNNAFGMWLKMAEDKGLNTSLLKDKKGNWNPSLNPFEISNKYDAAFRFNTDRVELNDRDARLGKLRWNGMKYKKVKLSSSLDPNVEDEYGWMSADGQLLKKGSAGANHLDLAETQRKSLQKTTALTSVAGSLAAGAMAAATQEGSAGDKAIAGVTNAVTTGLISAIPGVGPILGGVLGPLFGDLMTNGILKLIHAEEIAREERVKEAQEQLEYLEKIDSSLTEANSLAAKDSEEYSSEDYQKNAEIVADLRAAIVGEDGEALLENFAEELETVGYTSEDATTSLELASDALDEFAAVTENSSKIIAAYTAAQEKQKALALFGSQEQERYDLQQKIKDNYGAVFEQLDKVDWSQIEEAQEAGINSTQDLLDYVGSVDSGSSLIFRSDKYQAYQTALAQLEQMDEQVQEHYLNAALATSGVSSMSRVEISDSSLQGVIARIAREWVNDNPEILTSDGTFTDEAMSKIEALLRQDDRYSSLFDSGNLTYGEVYDSGNSARRKEIMEALGVEDYKEAMKLAGSGGEEAMKRLREAAEALSTGVNEMVDEIFNLDESKLLDFARALGVSTDFVQKNIEALGNLNMKDVLRGVDSLNERYKELGDIFADLADDMTLTAESMQKVVDKYSFLLKGENGISQGNILDNLFDIFMGGANSESGLAYGLLSVQEALSNENVWDLIKDQMSGEDNSWKGYFEGLTDEELATLNSSAVNKFSDLGANIRDKITEEGWDEIASIVQEVSGISELTEQLEESVVEHQKRVWEAEIDRLESVKEALDDINETRKKELDLIKAKDALENAKNEKKLVYREGVGWSYQTDQTAVQEAQQNLEDLEIEKSQEDIQYQIDQIQKWIDILEGKDEEEQARAQEEIFSQFVEKISGYLGNGEDDSYLKSILDFFSDDFQTEVKDAIIESGVGAYREMVTENEKSLLQDVSSSYSALEKAKEELNKTEAGTFERNEAIVNYNEMLQQYKDAVDAAKQSGITSDNLGDKLSQSGIDSSIASGIQSNWTSGYFTDKNKSSESAKYGVGLGSFAGQGWEGIAKWNTLTQENASTWLNGTFEQLPSRLVDQSGWQKQYGDALDVTWVLPYDSQKKTYSTQNWKRITEAYPGVDSLEEFSSMDPYTIFYNTDHADFAAFVGTDGKLYWVKSANEGDRGVGGNEVWWGGADKNDAYHHASGTLSAPGGLSYVNEFGTEGIITPSGTLTTLPSKSGVIPADLTRNLFELGEVAPNLVKDLDSMTSDFHGAGSVSSDDHSTNVQNLYATFQVEENFDFDRFLVDVRSVVHTSRHND